MVHTHIRQRRGYSSRVGLSTVVLSYHAENTGGNCVIVGFRWLRSRDTEHKRALDFFLVLERQHQTTCILWYVVWMLDVEIGFCLVVVTVSVFVFSWVKIDTWSWSMSSSFFPHPPSPSFVVIVQLGLTENGCCRECLSSLPCGWVRVANDTRCVLFSVWFVMCGCKCHFLTEYVTWVTHASRE